MDAHPDRSDDEERARHTRRRIELWPLTRPIPYEANPRNCPPEAIAKVAKSIKEFGFMQPIVVDAHDIVVVGTTRLLAAKSSGCKQVPVIVAADLPRPRSTPTASPTTAAGEETSWNDELLQVRTRR